jgi:hypothetical protein
VLATSGEAACDESADGAALQKHISFQNPQSAEGATQPKRHLIENIFRVESHAVFLQQGNKLVFKRFPLVVRFLLVNVPNHRGHIR